jgi:hypothetical protein
MKNKLARISVAVAFTLMTLATPALVNIGSASAQTFNDGGSSCSVMLPDGSGLTKPSAFVVTPNNPNVVETKVIVKGDASCKETVSVAGWNAPYGSTNFQPYASQRLVQGKTYTDLGVGTSTLYVLVNNACDYQADLVLGSSPTNNGTANYGDNLMGYKEFDAGTCQAPAAPAPVTPAPVTPAPTPTTPAPTTPTPTPTPAAVYTCDAITLTASANNTVSVGNLATTATNGATFSNVAINWGDNSAPVTTATAAGQTHSYATTGTYIVSATAHFSLNGQDVTASNGQCQESVTFAAATPPVVTQLPPVAPTAVATPAAAALVNTGPGSVIGIFAIATVAGTYLRRRSLRRQTA